MTIAKMLQGLRHAKFIGKNYSKDPRTKVGALILRADGTPVSWGYNGFPRGIVETTKLWNNREEKYKRVLHAESNAIDFARESLAGTTIFCSLFPCSNCAARIVQAGIKTVVFEGEPREDLGAKVAFEMFSQASIEIFRRNADNTIARIMTWE